jgi:hypothetical protein
MSKQDDLHSRIMVRCARHCCVCRKFKPLQLQIHHIKPEAKGGTDDEDNLIAICLDCHAAVHSQLMMAKNFTETELRMARDKVYELAESGKFHGAASLSQAEVVEIADQIAKTIPHNSTNQDVVLKGRAIRILLAAMSDSMPVKIRPMEVVDGASNEVKLVATTVICGLQRFDYSETLYPDIPPDLKDLQKVEFLVLTEEGFRPTEKAYKAFNYVSSENGAPSYFAKKFECLECHLHFAVFTWYGDKHRKSNIHCPECGQNSGKFYIWWQKEPGFIFETVPGNAIFYEGYGLRSEIR